MECKLCGQRKSLVKAHIIPDFMYRELFDKDHRIRQMRVENKMLKIITQRETGEFDKNILCEKCDNEILGGYEAYAKQVFYDGPLLNLPPEPERMYNNRWLPIGNIDYKRFKLFLLSILWRASVTSRPYFSQVKLDHHENIIRDMILNDNPQKKEDYPTLIIYTGLCTKQIISKPKLVGKKGDKIYTFLIANAIFIFFIECDNLPFYLLETTINENNRMKILLTEKANAADLINRVLFS